MNREILFRGQTRRYGEKLLNARGDKMLSNWVYGGIFPQNNGGDKAIIYQQEPKIEKCIVYADTVGQYIGLTDKSGKKIFEGDILAGHWNTTFTVYHDDCYLGFRAKTPSGSENDITYFCNYNDGSLDAEIIGNIHDNPELLKDFPKETDSPNYSLSEQISSAETKRDNTASNSENRDNIDIENER